MNIHSISAYLDELLRTRETPDYPNALNGLQVENTEAITRIGAAVDASLESIGVAAKRGCNLLLVHHGLFWEGNRAITGRHYQRLKLLLDRGMALYASHLPLDVHPDLGNNVLLARALDVKVTGSFGDFQGQPLGIRGSLVASCDELAARLEALLGNVRLIAGGREVIREIGIITGSAGSMIAAAAAAGLDAFITGEGNHHTYFDAMEHGINVYYGGHYATETFGVRALAENAGRKFNLPWEFFDLPTGL